MREIQFRAWQGKELIETFSIQFLNGKAGRVIKDDKYTGWIMEQFTGLLDKNKKEIYEGDIIDIADEVTPADLHWVIYWCRERAMFRARFGDLTSDINKNESTMYRVIGNIHSNPDLL